MATQPAGAVDRVEDFCTPDTIIEIQNLTDTVYVAKPTLTVATAVKTNEPWLWWGNQTVEIYGFNNIGDRKEFVYHSRPGWQFAMGNGVTFQEPRFAWMKTAFKVTIPFIAGYFTNQVIR